MNALEHLFEYLVLRIGGSIEDHPELLAWFFRPMCWGALALVLLAVVAYCWPRSRRFPSQFQRMVRHVAVLYAGVSLLTISLLSGRVFWVAVDGVRPEQLERVRNHQWGWLYYMGFLWGAGLAVVGGAFAIRVLCSLRKGHQETHSVTAKDDTAVRCALLHENVDRLLRGRAVLLELREGRLTNAVEALEVGLDADVLRIWQSLREADAGTRSTAMTGLRLVREYRRQFPREPARLAESVVEGRSAERLSREVVGVLERLAREIPKQRGQGSGFEGRAVGSDSYS